MREITILLHSIHDKKYTIPYEIEYTSYMFSLKNPLLNWSHFPNSVKSPGSYREVAVPPGLREVAMPTGVALLPAEGVSEGLREGLREGLIEGLPSLALDPMDARDPFCRISPRSLPWVNIFLFFSKISVEFYQTDDQRTRSHGLRSHPPHFAEIASNLG
jgi:hypothetical protein